MTLAALIADDEGRARRKTAARAFSAWWLARPAWAATRDRLDACDAADSDAILAAARPMLADVAWLHEGMARLAVLSRTDPLFEPPLPPLREGQRSGLRCHAHPLVTIAAIRLPRPAHRNAALTTTISFDGRPALARFLSGDPIVERYRCMEVTARHVESTMPDGEAILATMADEAWAVTGAGADVIVVQAAIVAGAAPPLRTFDRREGTLLSTAAADGAAMRMQLMASLLRHLGRTDGAAAIAEAAREGPHHLRWHLARELAALDRIAALPLIADLAATDPHPDVREAARLTLNRLAA